MFQETGQRVGMADDLLVPFLRADRQLAPLLERAVLCGTVHNCSRLLRRSPDEVVLIMNNAAMWYLSSRYFLDDRGRPMLQSLGEALYTFHVTTLVAKGSAILPALNDAVAHTQEGGLVVSWLSSIQTKINLYVSLPNTLACSR